MRQGCARADSAAPAADPFHGRNMAMTQHHQRPRLLPLAGFLLAAGFALAGCASDTGGTATSPATASVPAVSSPASTGDVDLKTAQSSLGEIVVDGKGMTLYYFTKDVKGSGESACTGDCLAAWPIAVASGGTPVVDPAVTGTVGTIDSPDGKKHLTLDGMPLYYYVKDTKPGDVLGQDVGDVWYVVAPDGDMIE